MQTRLYYSARTGKNPNALRYDLPTLKLLFHTLYRDLVAQERLQEMLGKDCVDDPDSVGTAGFDIPGYVLLKIRKSDLWPVGEHITNYSEDDLFDIIEFLYDHVSKGVEGYYHSFSNCGMHYKTFDRATARAEYRTSVNDLLRDYGSGYTLSATGEITHLPEAGFENLTVAGLPSSDPSNVDQRVQAAVSKYLRRSSGLPDRRAAVRDLADVLEYLRPQLKGVLRSKDEADLFHIANNFAIRHHNERQRTDYDPNIWTSWMFYFYLATIHAAQRLVLRREGGQPPPLV
jgi:hypothetical protein